jgi:hypothetical protein
LKVGFTGTQIGMTTYQACYVEHLLKQLNATRGIHGDCIGADAMFDKICKNLSIEVEIYPPSNPKKRAFCDADVFNPEDDYLTRNRKIVDASDVIIATPKSSEEELRSGTWATIRYARKKGKKVYIINPEN